MTSPKQAESNRRNAQLHATGPKSPGGKSKSKMNGLKHGLCSTEVTLPGEDPAEFQDYLDAWMDDFKPTTMARRELVEAAASAAWRRKRCIRVESARLSDRIRTTLANRRPRGRPAGGPGGARRRDPRGTLAALMADRPGVDALIAAWEKLAGDANTWDKFGATRSCITSGCSA